MAPTTVSAIARHMVSEIPKGKVNFESFFYSFSGLKIQALTNFGGVLKGKKVAAKQVKTVSMSELVQGIKADTGTCKQMSLGKGLTTVKESKRQAAHKARMVDEMAGAQNEDKDTELVFLLGKYTVEAHFLDDIDRKFCEIYPSMVDEVSYTPAEIVGEMFWAKLTAMGQRLAILCLKHLATEPDVPLVDLTCTDCGRTSFAVV